MSPSIRSLQRYGAASLLILVGAVAPAAAQWSDASTAAVADTIQSHGVAWVDFDNDGDLDIYLANNGNNKLLRNDGEDPGNPGQWLFTNVAPSGTGVGSSQVSSVGVWGDYDDDGDPDVYLSDTQGANRLFRNDPADAGYPDDPNRVFVDVTNSLVLGSTRASQSAAWVDYDNDGDLDLFVADAVGNYLLRNDGADQANPGMWIFTDVTSAAGVFDASDSQGVAWADYDDDGDQDLFVVNYNSTNRLLRNDPANPLDPDDPSRTFTNVTIAEGLTDTGPGRGAAWGDFDNDGDLDLYVTNYGSGNLLYRNDGGSFTSIGTAAGVDDAGNGRSCTWVDFDNDGDLDLWLTNFDDGVVTDGSRLWRNDGPDVMNPDSWLFTDVTDPLLANEGGQGSAAGWADYDGDGDLDAYIVNWNADHPNLLVRNDLSSGAGFLHVTLSGKNSNRSAIGARVTVATGDTIQVREVNGGEGWHGQNTLTCEFGLGAAAQVDSMTVAWPSGEVQKLYVLAPNQWMSVQEDGPNAPTMNPEPPYTAGTTNTVSWSDESASGASEYRVVAAEDVGFTTVFDTSGWTTALFYEFSGLADGQQVYYRVQSRDSTDVRSRWSQSVTSLQDNSDPVSSVSALPDTVQAVPFDVPYTAEDTGSGVAAVVLWYRYGGGSWTLFGTHTDLTPFLFTIPDGPGDYDFYTIAIDYLNNIEPPPASPDASVVVEPAYWTNVAPTDGSLVGNDGNGRGAAWGDYDGDGRPDLFLTNRPVWFLPDADTSNHLYHNLGPDGLNPDSWLFEDVTGSGMTDPGYGQGVCWGDYDGDGDLDVYQATMAVGDPAPNHLFRNEGDGTFVDVGAQTGTDDDGSARTVAFVDFDNDGDLDLYLTNDGQNRLYRNDGEDPFQPGNWLFTDISPADGSGIGDNRYTMGCGWADFDNDGDQDVYLANYNNTPNVLLRNDGPDPQDPDVWLFTDVAPQMGVADGGSGMGVSWGDYDNDGWLDLYLTCDGANHLYHRIPGADAFEDVTAASGAGLGDASYTAGAGWCDYDNDGDLDLYVGNHWTNPQGDWVPNHLFRNDGEDPLNPGTWVFTDVAPQNGYNVGAGINTTAVAWADIDGDGDQDLYLANMTGIANLLFRNDVPDAQTNHWLQLDLVSKSLNTAAIGARVRATVGGDHMIREVAGCTGFVSQSSLTVALGLGAAAQADSLEIRWPSGIVQTLTNVAADQRLTIVERGPDIPVLASLPAYTPGDSVSLAWSTADGVAPIVYQVLRSTSPAFTVVDTLATTPDTTLVDAGLSDHFTGYWRVRAVDADQIPSRWSNTVSTTMDASPPTSRALPIDLVFQGLPFTVAHADTDTISGVATVSLYHRFGDDQGPFDLIGTVSDGTPFPVDLGQQYGVHFFYTRATDVVGNVEDAPAGADVSVEFGPPQWVLVSPADSTGVGNGGNGRGAAWGDYDRDGDPDLFITNRIEYHSGADAENHLFRNDGADAMNPDSWLFTDTTTPTLADPNYGMGAAWADFDGDGDLDLYSVNLQANPLYPAPNHLYRNDGSGTFVDIGVETGTNDENSGRSCSWIDFDGDGDADLYLCNDGPNRLYRNDGEDPQNPGHWLFTNVAPTDSTGIGDGSYTMGCAWSDFDNDGDPDLYLANYMNEPNKLFRNDGEDPQNPGQWRWTDIAPAVGVDNSHSSLGCQWGDFDNDGLMDLFVSNDGPNALYRNISSGSLYAQGSGAKAQIEFVDIAPMYTVKGLDDDRYGSGIGWADFDNDGDLDLFVGNHWYPSQDPAPDFLFRNDGPDSTNAQGWLFTNVAPTEQGVNIADDESTNSVTWADYDGDGDLDLYLATMSGYPNKLFRNDVADSTGNHWLHLDLAAAGANTAAVGARVRCVAGGVGMIRDVDGGSGFLSQGTLTVEFGLGAAVKADSVEIIWPDGSYQLMYNVAADQRLSVPQGPTAVPEPPTTPTAFRVYANYPNPFNPSTTIRFDLPSRQRVRLQIYALTGARVRTLFDGELPAGVHRIVWDGRDRRGGRVASGVYFYRVRAGDKVETRKMLLVK